MNRSVSRIVGAVAAVALAVSSCTGTAQPTSTTGSSVVPTTTSSTIPVTIAPTTTTVEQSPPVGWIAPSGVIVAVTGANGDLIEVMTPCGDPAVLEAGEPVYDVEVLIDPGHGGPVDTGAVAPTGLPEKELNLRVSLVVAEILNERGIATVLTRTGDYPIPIRTRSDYAELMGAKVLVSLHHNAPVAPSSGIPGVEIFRQHDSNESERLGGLIFEETMKALSQFDIDWDRAPDAGVMTVLNTDGDDAYGMVRLPEMVSVLVELGYLANRAEAELFASIEYQREAATAVANGIERFLTTAEPGAGFVEGRVFNPNRGVGKDRCVEPELQAALYPKVLAVEVIPESTASYRFDVTISSPYDSAERYADAWRVIGFDGVVYGERILLHDHATEQPFTRSLTGVEIPEGITTVYVEARDQVYGWGGAMVEVELP